MGASMCVPVCMFVRTSTVLLPSRWCVVMSVTWIASNCGQVGIRSPHGCVRSTSFIALVREVLLAKLKDDAIGEREVDDLVERDRFIDLLVVDQAQYRSLDVLLHDHLVLWPRLPGLERLVSR